MYSAVSDVWDSCTHKLMVSVVEAKNLPATSSPYVKVTLGASTQTTSTLRRSSITIWDELLFFNGFQQESSVSLQIFSANGTNDILLGSVIIPNVCGLPADRPLAKWFNLLNSANEQTEMMIQIRLLYSSSTEIRHNVDHSMYTFAHERHIHLCKTGDLIAFCGTGLVAALSMMFSDAPISSVGIVLKVANKWTQQTELFIAEISRNPEKFPDAFTGLAQPGLQVFRFTERLHQFHGPSIFWCPLKQALEPEGEQRLIQYVFSLQKQPLSSYSVFKCKTSQRITDWATQRFGDIGDPNAQFIDLLSAPFVTECLRRGSVFMGTKEAPRSAMEIVRYECFNRPTPLRLSGAAGSQLKQLQSQRSSDSLLSSQGNVGNLSPTTTANINVSTAITPPLASPQILRCQSDVQTRVPPRSPNRGSRSLPSPDFQSAKVERYEKLGSGGFGAVYRCSLEGFTCAMKVMKIGQHTKKMDIASVKTEVAILERAKHPNIVRYLGFDFNPSELILFMEFCPFSLQGILTKKLENPECIYENDPKEVHFFALEIAKGIAYLHTSDPPIIHRDIKSGNVLVSKDGEGKVSSVKLCDFGVAKICETKISAANTFVGTPGLMAPEIRMGNQSYSEKVDIWSYGILIYEMITFSSPQLPNIWIPQGLDPLFGPLLNLVRLCLMENPAQRPTAKQIVECLALMYT